MMLSIMIYGALIAGLLGAAAHVFERLLANLGAARRGVWIGALVASLALPAYSILTREAMAPAATQPAVAQASAPAADAPKIEVAEGRDDVALTLPDWSRWSLFRDWYVAGGPAGRAFDRPLVVLWAASSATMVLIYCLAWVGLQRARRHWRAARVDNCDVLVSRRLGPAMFGFIKPLVVIPQWLLDAPAEVRGLALRHEREHVAAKDHWILALALALCALAPWNLVLWWQLRRLRLAMEIDCDARVLRDGVDAKAYSSALLAVRQRHVASPLAAVALLDPVSELERRIRLMLQAPKRASRMIITVGTVITTALVVVACVVTPPTIQAPGVPAPDRPADATHQPETGMRVAGERIVIVVEVSASMLGRAPADIARWQGLPPEQQRQSVKWQQLTHFVDGLAAQIPASSQFQIIAFNDEARSLVAGTDGQWLAAANGIQAERAVRTLREETIPQGESNLHAALTAAATLRPAPDSIYIITDSLPSAGPVPPDATDDEDQRVRRFDLAVAAVPSNARVDVVLLPMDDDAFSAPAYWSLALRTGGTLLAPAEDVGDEILLGMPLDSEYLAFVVDTSGSMRQYVWDDVQRLVAETIATFPTVKGIQILSDEGQYLMPQFRGDWIPYSAENTAAALELLTTNWSAFSDSSPGEGILAVIDSLHAPDRKIAIFVYGDDLARGSVNEILTSITERNRLDGPATRKARIHSVAFPVYYAVTGSLLTSANYAALMRDLSQRNGGSFVAPPVDRLVSRARRAE